MKYPSALGPILIGCDFDGAAVFQQSSHSLYGQAKCTHRLINKSIGVPVVLYPCENCGNYLSDHVN